MAVVLACICPSWCIFLVVVGEGVSALRVGDFVRVVFVPQGAGVLEGPQGEERVIIFSRLFRQMLYDNV